MGVSRYRHVVGWRNGTGIVVVKSITGACGTEIIINVVGCRSDCGGVYLTFVAADYSWMRRPNSGVAGAPSALMYGQIGTLIS